MPEKPKLSIIVPVLNEEENLPILYQRLIAVIRSLSISYEIIFIDDGSSDNSFQVIEELNKNDSRVKSISFSRNFGHMIALSAGLNCSSGQAVIIMDADLQHPPELIPELLKRWESGGEVVNTIRKSTKREGFFKRISSKLFYLIMDKLANVKLVSSAADFKLLDRKVVESLKEFKERSRFLRGLISWVGFKQEFVEYQADLRHSGKSKYSLSRMLSFSVDGITSFSSFPLRLSTYLGLVVAFFSFLNILYALYIRIFTNQAIAGWASVLVAVLFIGGIQLIFLGIIGEYLSRVFEETKERPLYIIDKKIGL